MGTSKIVYNEQEVWKGKELLSKVPENITTIAGNIDAGIAMIMSTTFKGSVNIDTTTLQTSAQNVETTISDITTVEQKISAYSKDGPYKKINGNMYPHWAAALVGGTLYSDPESAQDQMEQEYNQKKQELTILSQKVGQGDATPLEVAKAKELVIQVEKLEEQTKGLAEQSRKSTIADKSTRQNDSKYLYDFAGQEKRANLFATELKDLTTGLKAASIAKPEERDLYYNQIRVITRVEEASSHADSITRSIVSGMQPNDEMKHTYNNGGVSSRVYIPDISQEHSDMLQREAERLEYEIENSKAYLSENVQTALNDQIAEIKIVQRSVDEIVDIKKSFTDAFEKSRF